MHLFFKNVIFHSLIGNVDGFSRFIKAEIYENGVSFSFIENVELCIILRT